MSDSDETKPTELYRFRPSVGIARKIAQSVTTFALLSVIRRRYGFETAVLAGLALNSADLNETREKLADALRLTRGMCGLSRESEHE